MNSEIAKKVKEFTKADPTLPSEAFDLEAALTMLERSLDEKLL